MPGSGGIPQVGAGRIGARLIAEGALQDEDLFAASVAVALEPVARGVAHDRGRPGHLGPAPIEHPALDARHRGRGPGECQRVQHGPLAEIGVQFHAWIVKGGGCRAGSP